MFYTNYLLFLVNVWVAVFESFYVTIGLKIV